MQVSDDPKGMAKRITALLTDGARWRKASASAAGFAAENFSTAAVMERLDAIWSEGRASQPKVLRGLAIAE